jgi:hypothetical protein
VVEGGNVVRNAKIKMMAAGMVKGRRARRKGRIFCFRVSFSPAPSPGEVVADVSFLLNLFRSDVSHFIGGILLIFSANEGLWGIMDFGVEDFFVSEI